MGSRFIAVRSSYWRAILLAGIVTVAINVQAQTPIPSPTPDASPTPQVSATPSLEKHFFKNILHDQVPIFTAPLHFGHDTKWLLPLGLSTAALITTDPYTARLDNDPSRHHVSRDISYLGSVYTTAVIDGGIYLYGRAEHNDRARETGLLGGEALIDAGIVALVVKTVTQRPRPRESDGRGEFFEGGRSFPSGHSIAAWSLATVIAEEYKDRPLVRFSAYGLATAVSLSRYTGHNHFLSDVLIGSAAGYGIGRYVYKTHHDPSLDRTSQSKPPAHSKFLPLVAPTYSRSARIYGLALAWDF